MLTYRSAQPGSAQPGSAQPGSAQPGSAQPGSAQPGSAQPGPAPQPADGRVRRVRAALVVLFPETPERGTPQPGPGHADAAGPEGGGLSTSPSRWPPCASGPSYCC